MYRRLLHRRYKFKRIATLVLVFSILVWLVWMMRRFTYDFFLRNRNFDQLIVSAGARHNIDPLLLKSVIWQESRFNPNARGSKNEIGLMQLRECASVADWKVESGREYHSEGILFNPSVNIEIGAWYLSRALRKWTDYDDGVRLALCEYNAGASGMKKWLPPEKDGTVTERITVESTKEYVNSIMEKYYELLASEDL